MISWWLGGDLGAAGSLAWTTPQWVVIAAALLALAAWALAAVGSRGSRLLELGLWGWALMGLMVAIAGPVWVEEAGRVEPGRVIVMVDGSRSMATLEGGTPRSDAVEPILRHLRSEAPEAEIFHFGRDLEIGPPAEFELPDTDLGGALDALSERVAGEQLAGIALVTDGLDRGLLRKSSRDVESVVPPTLPGPLTVFQVGQLTDVTDLAVRDVDAGGYAFIRAPFTIKATIEGLGFGGRRVPVSLLRDGATVTEKRVALDEAGRGQVTFEVVAPRAGRFAYTVQVPVYDGDAVPSNNAMPVVVKVVRDRIRVLQVAGAPSWDVKFLRRFLKEDPSVQLVSFFILRTQRDLVSQYVDRELSLIQFPYRRLFEEDLSTFDVVVFQNFDYRPYFGYGGEQLLQNIADYVNRGGALVMVGGDRSFNLGDYGNTPLASVLPVEIGGPGAPDLGAFRPQLTPEGERHPITRLVADPVENRAWWERMREMDGTNVVRGVKAQAAVLLTHPTLTDAQGAALPVLAAWESDKGRAMALTVDASWRWSLSEAAEGRGNQAYLRFWKNSLRWLMQDAATARVTVETARENYAVGEDVRVVVRARTPGFAPLASAAVALTVDNEGRSSSFEGRTNADGEVVISVPATHGGTHRLSVQVDHDEEAVGSAESVYAVTTRDPESDEVAPDAPFLEWLAQSTGGRYHPPGARGPLLRDPSAGRTVREVAETELWRAPILILAIAVFSGLAWLVRRRAGLR